MMQLFSKSGSFSWCNYSQTLGHLHQHMEGLDQPWWDWSREGLGQRHQRSKWTCFIGWVNLCDSTGFGDFGQLGESSACRIIIQEWLGCLYEYLLQLIQDFEKVNSRSTNQLNCFQLPLDLELVSWSTSSMNFPFWINKNSNQRQLRRPIIIT